MRNILIPCLIFFVTAILSCNGNKKNPDNEQEGSPIENLENWLVLPVESREPLAQLEFAKKPLSKEQAKSTTAKILEDKQAQILSDFGPQWDARLITLGEFKMPFYYQVFGDEPVDGRSLFISMHGGGGAPAEVNDQQYKNQQHLYDSVMNLSEAVYLAPRAPTDAWDLWHQDHIDKFFNLLIQLAVIKEKVNPDKVYLLGYSAGGDGVYQLAPRMADRFAAASMMAGHPNETSPLGLKNLPFALHMGALDSAYERNLKAAQWKAMLDSLENAAPGTYIHQVVLHEGMGHWMKLQDAMALPWMKGFQRNTLPEAVLWKQDDRHHSAFYWLGVPQQSIVTGGEVRADYDSSLNEINITQNYSDTLQLFMHDNMLNLDKPVTIKYKGQVIFNGKVERTLLNIYNTIMDKGDAALSFPAMVSVINNTEVVK